jgi:3-hydroxyisobutyrate dehydrogenase
MLGQLCRRLEYLGPLGAGPRLKLAANLLLTIFWQALGESLLLADVWRNDCARVLDLLADSNIAAGILRARAPQIVASLHGQAPGSAAFDVDAMRKDLRYMLQEGAARGAVLPLAGRTLQALDLAASEGAGKVDSTSYPAYWLARHASSACGGARHCSRNGIKSTQADPIGAPSAIPDLG